MSHSRLSQFFIFIFYFLSHTAIHSLLWLIVLYALTQKKILINHQNMWDAGDEKQQTTLPSRGSRTRSERLDGHRGEMKHGMGTLQAWESLLPLRLTISQGELNQQGTVYFCMIDACQQEQPGAEKSSSKTLVHFDAANDLLTLLLILDLSWLAWAVVPKKIWKVSRGCFVGMKIILILSILWRFQSMISLTAWNYSQNWHNMAIVSLNSAQIIFWALQYKWHRMEFGNNRVQILIFLTMFGWLDEL